MSDRTYLVSGSLASGATMAAFVACAAWKVPPNWFGVVGLVHTVLVFGLVYLAWDFAEDHGLTPGWWGLWTFVVPWMAPLVLALLPDGEGDADIEDWRPRLVVLAIVAALALGALLSAPLDSPARLPVAGLVVLVLSAFTAVHYCGEAADEVFESGVGWALAGFLIPFAVPLLLAVILTLSGDGEHDMVSSVARGTHWRCPACRTVLEKKNADLVEILGGANIVGTVTCGACHAQYGHRDVYSGRYDV